MDEAGVRFTAGLDMGMVHAYHDLSAANAWAFVEWLGWSPWRAIYTATAGTAEGVRVGDIVGRIKPGMIADLAAFDGDPAQNIRHLNIASSVIKNGVPVKLDNRNLV
jgi:imidazolonepropionase-like amidohydrolase